MFSHKTSIHWSTGEFIYMLKGKLCVLETDKTSDDNYTKQE